MNLIQWIEFHLDEAIKMLMDDRKSKTECALFLMDFKDSLYKPEKDIVDADGVIIDELKYLDCKQVN